MFHWKFEKAQIKLGDGAVKLWFSFIFESQNERKNNTKRVHFHVLLNSAPPASSAPVLVISSSLYEPWATVLPH